MNYIEGPQCYFFVSGVEDVAGYNELIRSLLQDLHVFSYEPEDATATAAVRAALAKRGTPIGPYDVMIAGTALRRGLVMVTSNGGEFARIDGLILEDWRVR